MKVKWTFQIRYFDGSATHAHTVEAACSTAAWMIALNDNGGPQQCRAILEEVS